MSKSISLPSKIVYAYSCGIVGCSMLINMISVIIIYFFVPTKENGLPTYIFQGTLIGSVTLLTLITSGGRLIDALYDPFIAQKSDQSTSKSGRRIPFMRFSALPAALFCFLVFYPLTSVTSSLNALWLTLTLVLFYVSITSYMIPYLAMLPELAKNPEEKVKLSTWQSVGYVFGIALTSNTYNIAAYFEDRGFSTPAALQLTIGIFCFIALIFLVIPVFTIREREWCSGEPVTVKLLPALKQTLRNTQFRMYLLADFAFNLSLAIILACLLFYVTILLPLGKEMGNKLMMVLVGASLLFYPLMSPLTRRFGYKILISFSLVLLGIVFLGIYFLGKVDLSPEVQMYSVIALASIPMASLSILPTALLAGIIEKESEKSKVNKEGMFFAVRYFFVKLSQTVGIGLCTMLLTYGCKIGNDLGIRLTGVMGCMLCVSAGLYFLRYKER
jgi:GPH family glycoside/pentoside/hexuronide:cation symporter